MNIEQEYPDLKNVINSLKKQEKFYSDRKMLEESNIYFETIMYNKNEHKALKYAIKVLVDNIETRNKILEMYDVNNYLPTTQCVSCEKTIPKNEAFVFCGDCSGYKYHVNITK